MGFIEILFPVLAIAFTGFLVAKFNLLSSNDCDSIAKFAFHYAIPTLLFLSTSRAHFPPDLDIAFLASYYIAAFLIFGLAVGVGRTLFGYSFKQSSSLAMGASYSNATIVGVPVCLQFLGEDGLLPLFIIVSIHNLVMFSIGMFVAEKDSQTRGTLNYVLNLLKQLMTSPITLSLIAGLFVNFMKISFYPPLENALEFFSQAAVPMALFALGTTLSGFRISGQVLPACVISAFKLVLMPCIVYVFAFRIFDLPPVWAKAAVITAAMPVGVVAYVYAQRIQALQKPVAAGIVISSLGCLLSLSIILPFLKNL